MSADSDRTAGQYRDASNLGARIALHKRFSTNPRGFQRWVFEHLELPEEARILEVGCGPGTLWVENLERVPPGWNVILTDASPGMVEAARHGLRNARTTFRFAVADAQDLPFADGSFDAVIAAHMLYHVPDRNKAFSEIVRVLGRGGGRMYAATNGVGHMRELAAMLRVLDPAWSGDTISVDLPNFNLENGAEQLSPWFGEVTLLRYEDSLAVTEAKPLLDYLLSGLRTQELRESLPNDEVRRRVAVLEDRLQREMRARGSIRVAKDTGMFLARP